MKQTKDYADEVWKLLYQTDNSISVEDIAKVFKEALKERDEFWLYEAADCGFPKMAQIIKGKLFEHENLNK